MESVYEKLENILPEYINRIKNGTNTEDDIVHEFTYLIQQVFDVGPEELDFQTPVKSKVLQVRGRMDAVFKNIILEFKKDLNDERALNTAKEELKKYFQSLYELDPKIRHLGIILDGLNFRVYQATIENHQISKLEQINMINFNASNSETILNWFDSFFLGDTQKITPTSKKLKQTFGLNSPTYALVRQELIELFNKIKDNPRIKIKYDNWSKFLEIVYGDKPKEINLFITHTYLSTFVKLLMYLRLSEKDHSRNYNIEEILDGKIFFQYNIKNFVEDDFFTWIIFNPIRIDSTNIFKKILKDLEVYDLEMLDGDILKELYQEMVQPHIGKQLGEFYTPDWLAEKMVEETLRDNPKKSVLDPSCGSGTFLLKTIDYKIKKFQELKIDDSKILSHILENVIGFDIHPLAALISKTNYLLALKEIIHTRKGSITIPVYLSDSLKIPEKITSTSNSISTFELTTDISNKKFVFPESITDSIVKMDSIMEKMKDQGRIFEQTIQESTKLNPTDIEKICKNQVSNFKNTIKDIQKQNEEEILVDNIKTLFELIMENSDSIWPYIIRNMYKPLAISFKKVDVVLGNPPWLAFQFMKNLKYQNYLKSQSKKYGLVDPKQMQNIAHLELATLFFCQCADNFLVDHGTIGFVMPHSILISSQHQKFLKFENPEIAVQTIFDLKDVTPMFKILSCVIIGIKNNPTKFPVPLQIVRGKLKSTNEQLKDTTNFLEFKKSKFVPIINNKTGRYYEDKFASGASIYPRIFWLVDLQTHSSFGGFDPEKPYVVSSDNPNLKPPWDNFKISGNVEKQFLFNTALATDLVHFGLLRNRLVVLPIIENQEQYEIISNFNDSQYSHFEISTYLKTVENIWQENATPKSKNWSVYRRLNYNSDLIKQKHSVKYKVLYIVSGTYLTSCVIDMTKEPLLKIGKNQIMTSGFIVDYTNYYFETNSKDEAYYLSSILNSKTLDDLIKPEQVKGAFGPRHISKIPLKFPIPKFDDKNINHMKLAMLGMTCHKKVKLLVPTLNYRSTGKIRNVIRGSLKNEISQINEIVNKLFEI